MLFFEEIPVRKKFVLPEILLTQELRDQHTAYYGEDWPEGIAKFMRTAGIIPSTLIISLVAGQMGNMEDPLAIMALKQYNFKVKRSFRVGDVLETQCAITEKSPSWDTNKHWGYVWVQQKMCNKTTGEVVYSRTIKYAVLYANTLEKLNTGESITW